ncbi:MAG: PorT family protein [Prevotella sp.]|nr:PorT family protein [Prevotella sp.]
MKKFFLSIVAALLAVPTFAQIGSGGFSVSETSVYYGVRLGMNISTITGKYVDADSKVGMTLGGVIGLRVSETTPVFLESGLYYSGRGAKDLNLNYLEVPILIKYGIQATDQIALLPFVGPYFSLGISGQYKYEDVDMTTGKTVSVKDSSYDWIKRTDMGFKVGCGLEYNMLYAEAGYQFGVSDIAKDNPLDNGAHTGNVFINIGVNF